MDPHASADYEHEELVSGTLLKELVKRHRLIREGLAHRYYCPECGCVEYGWQIGDGMAMVEEHAFQHGDKWRITNCPGGYVDDREDRAP